MHIYLTPVIKAQLAIILRDHGIAYVSYSALGNSYAVSPYSPGTYMSRVTKHDRHGHVSRWN